MHERAARKAWYSPHAALEHAGDLKDTVAGHRKYIEYLAWLMEDEPARKKMMFETMSKGWVVGTNDYVKSVLAEQESQESKRRLLVGTKAELNEEIWREALQELLRKGDCFVFHQPKPLPRCQRGSISSFLSAVLDRSVILNDPPGPFSGATSLELLQLSLRCLDRLK